MKKFLSLFLSLVMILSVFIGGTVTAGAETYGVLTYELSGDKVTITGCDENASGEVVIPAEIDGYPVTSIGRSAFSGCTGLTSITIGNSVTRIGDYAFSGCTGLESITVDEGNPVYHSSGNCLIKTESKTLIVGCKNSVIPDDGSVTSIGEEAFYYCTGLTGIIIPNSVTSIGDYAFDDCTGLTSINIPDSVTGIGTNPFAHCTGLESITVDEGNTVYHSSGNCLIETGSQTLIASCKNSVIPDDGSVTSIGDYAFWGCTGLTSVTIPDSVTSVSNGAFAHCTGLTSITIPNSVTSIDREAFEGCSGLTSIAVDESNPVYHSANNCLIETASKTLVLGCKNSVIPDDGSVTSIGEEAFYYCTGLTGIIIPNSVTIIDRYAFYGCAGLTSITIPDSVTSIGRSAFYDCAGLTSIAIPDSVTSIGDDAFHSCTGLTSINIPNSVTSIGERAFEYCTGLTSVNIPDSVYEIDAYAFYNCSELKDVYYAGTEAQWNMIDIKEGNDNLINAGPYPYNPDDSDNLTLYYSSNYMAIGHMYSVKPRIIILDEPLSNWTRDGYTFMGWALSSDANEAEYQPGDKYNLTEDTTFYAVWKSNNSDIPDDKDIVYESPEGVALYDDYSAKMPDGRTVKNAIDISVAENGVKFNLTQLTSQQDEGFGGIKYGCSCKFDLSLADPGAADISETNPATIRFKKDFIGRDIKNIVIFHYPAHGGRESFTAAKNDPRFRINDDGEYWKITATSLSPFGIYYLPALSIKSSATVDYKANVTVTATAENVPDGYVLAIYEGSTLREKGNASSVSYKAGAMTADRTFTVKITDSGNNALKDIEENEIKANCEVKVKTGFFDKLIAFFKGLFGLLPNVEIKP